MSETFQYPVAGEQLSFRRPTFEEVRRYFQQVNAGNEHTPDATDEIARACVVESDAARLGELLEEYGRISEPLGAMLVTVGTVPTKAAKASVSEATAEQIEEWKKAGKMLAYSPIEADGVKFYLRRPNQIVGRAYSMRVREDRAEQFDAGLEMLDACVEHPPKSERDRLFKDAPGLVKIIAGELNALSLASSAAESKKL